MTGDAEHRGKGRLGGIALKTRVAGVVAAGAVVSLVLAPEALARLTANHNETVVRLD
jgi:hypothetical protein